MNPVDTMHSHAETVRAAVIGSHGETAAALRATVVGRAAGGGPAPAPYDELARQIGEAAYLVTDTQVSAVRDAAGGDKAAFEIVLSACVGAGLSRWDAAVHAIEAADDASS